MRRCIGDYVHMAIYAHSYSRNKEVGSMGVGASLYMYDVSHKKFTFAISSPDEFLSASPPISDRHKFVVLRDAERRAVSLQRDSRALFITETGLVT